MRRALLVILATLGLSVAVAEAAVRSDGSTLAPKQLVQLVTHVPGRTLNQVGTGGATARNATKPSGGPFQSRGKPEVLTVNLAWCPHCAANSWPLAIALSRFGELTGLRIIDTGTLFCTKFHAKPCFPHTHGLSLLRAHLKSSYISLAAVVLQDVKGHKLEPLTQRENSAISSFDHGGFPAVDVGGMYGFVGPAYRPGILHGKTWTQIAGKLASGKGRVTRSIEGSANLFTAAICKATAGKPAGVCKSKAVTVAAARLPG